MFEEVSSNVFFLPSPNESGNCFLLVGKKIVLIDTGLSSNAKRISKSLASLGLKPDDVNLILHTHGHADHFSADVLFSKAQVRMSEFDGLKVSLHDSLFSCSELFNESFFPKVSSYFLENEVIEFAPFKLRVLKTPGHTSGSVCFFEKSKKLLFSGDTLFYNGVGRFDFISGSKSKLSSSLEMLSKIEFDTLLPGHGGVFKGDQKENIKNSVNAFLFR